MWGLLFLITVSGLVSIEMHSVTQEFSSDELSVISGSVLLLQIISELAEAHNDKDIFTKELDKWSSANKFIACTTCRAVVDVLARTFRGNDEIFKSIAMDVCDRYQLQTTEVCTGLIDFYIPSMMHIINNSKADSRTFCALVMGFNICNIQDISYNWTLNIDSTGVEVTAPKSELGVKNGKELRILHLTDIHYDPLYAPGSLAECDEPLCCQRGVGSTEIEKAAGYWGDYRNCDASWHMIVAALKHIKTTHPKIDFIYQTGDLVHHMIWGTSEEKNIDMSTKVNILLAEIFQGVPVYSCIGNHETHPVNLFSPVDAPEGLNIHWLYENLFQQWSNWLPADTNSTFIKGGYYTVSPKSGFRVIALNNNDCYTSNWWLFYDGTNKIPQLQWLHDTLLVAERDEEYVHILAHIPTGDRSCWSVWAREFNRLVERFRNTISGIFNGHSHRDEMHLHYSENGYAIGIAWNGGSLTTFSKKNPNYKLYHVENESMQVVDHETWIFNLTEANVNGESQEPNWFKEYEFSTEFTADLSPAGIDKLLDEMADKPDILRKYWRYKMTTSDPMITKGCYRPCLLRTICRLATTISNQKTRCKELRTRLNFALDNENITSGTTALPTTLQPPEETTEGNKNDGAAPLSLDVTTMLIFILFCFEIF
ncbi:sphingomyelin phosphodiesterase-like [Eurosta solidaginis]|uniref:sphingomyelin phosphodiesterase-like n=1 Tax=Eurosta solidaginis TaxID=178769 RepID=UPI0035314176